jgi:RHS repeat-associated protein
VWQSTGGVDDYLHSDMIGTLRMTTIGSGPQAGTPGLDRVFTAFGERITGPTNRNGYAGAWGYQSHDVPGGSSGSGSAVPFDFLHVGHRYYDPSSGRFLQRDPIGIGGELNVYAYVLNIPTVGVDPSGLFPWTWADLMAAMSGGAAAGAAGGSLLGPGAGPGAAVGGVTAGAGYAGTWAGACVLDIFAELVQAWQNNYEDEQKRDKHPEVFPRKKRRPNPGPPNVG